MNYPVLDLKATGERINQLRKDNNLRVIDVAEYMGCLLYTSPSPRDGLLSRMPSSA